MRGGYSRTNDYGFININLNIASAFPFVFALNPSLTNAYGNLLSAAPPPTSDLAVHHTNDGWRRFPLTIR